ncbi:hypothetical protein [Siphonobacter sp.]|uniref:hypothetical protein n=1 Tax=Siphonobacter sp. TaxID=1869184 RepID=UPI003B3B8D62
MGNDSQKHQKVYQIAEGFITRTVVRELQGHLSQMFAHYAVSIPFHQLEEDERYDVAVAFTSMVELLSKLAEELHDVDAQDYIALGKRQAAA